MKYSSSELKATLTDFANALYEAREEANSNLVWETLEYIEDLEDKNTDLYNNLYGEKWDEEPCDPLTSYEVFGE